MGHLILASCSGDASPAGFSCRVNYTISIIDIL